MKKIYKCLMCNKKFERYESTVGNENRVCCSKTCLYKLMSIEKSGIGNPRYKTGKYVNPICKCGLPKDPRSKQCSKCARKSKGVGINKVIEDDILIEFVKNNKSFFDISKKLNASRAWVTNRIKELKLDISHFNSCSTRPYNNKKILIKDSKVRQQTLKKYIIENNLLKYICYECGNIGKWNNKPIVLELHHINGVNNDNRIENLTFLCPNCHSQTITYKGKNGKGKQKLHQR